MLDGPIAVINAGGWGTALAVMLASNGRHVRLWARRAAAAEQLAAERENRAYLPGVSIPPAVEITGDLGRACAGAGVVLLAPISRYLREQARQLAAVVEPGAVVVSATKGFEADTWLRGSEVLASELRRGAGERLAVLSGPTHAEEVARGVPTAAVLACADPELGSTLQRLLGGPGFRLYTNDDVLGVEVCGAVKNVIALAAGAGDGLGYGDNTKASLITRGLAELGRLVAELGGRPATVSGLAGLGDIIATCTSRHSRNRRAGELLGRGQSPDEIVAGTNQVVEGLPATRATMALAARAGVELPIAEQVHAVLFDNRQPRVALAALMGREPRREH